MPSFGVHDWAARLVPALAGVLTVLVTYFWGRRVVGERAGLCGALVLCLSARFVYLERELTMDCLLCLWTTAGLAAAHAALVGGRFRTGWWLLSAGACALGVLTKGPVALVLIVVPTAAYSLLERRAARVGLRGWAGLPGRRPRRGGAVVRGDQRRRTGLRRVVLLEAQRRPLRGAVRPRGAGVVPPAAAAARHVAVEPAAARLPRFPRPVGRRARRRDGRPALGFFLLAAALVAGVFLRRRVQTGRSTSCRRCRRWPWRWGATSTP